MIKNVISYINYLKIQHQLRVSIHYNLEMFDKISKEITHSLRKYNNHISPYCLKIKGKNYNECLLNQKIIIKKAKKHSGVLNICHAGVCEYIYPFFKDEIPMGYIAVSGYKGNDMFSFCDTVIPPLGIMLENILIVSKYEKLDEFDLIIQFLNEYHTNITLEDLANHFNRSKSHISHLFKRKTGFSFRAYCNNLKLNDSKKLLEKTDVPITSIAMDLGFADTSYYIYLFKEEFGVTPLQYRKQKQI